MYRKPSPFDPDGDGSRYITDGWVECVGHELSADEVEADASAIMPKEILHDPFTGPGKPEPLKHILSGAWSRRIDESNRLVYLVTDTHIVVLQARDHS